MFEVPCDDEVEEIMSDSDADSEDDYEEFHMDADASNAPKFPMSSADQECYDLLKQIQAREGADAINLDAIDEDLDCLVSFPDREEQRLGRAHSGKSKAPPPMDKATWDDLLKPDDASCSKDPTERDRKSQPVTLAGVLSQVRLGGQEPTSINPVLGPLWKCLIQLRKNADGHVLPRPEKFRILRRKLNWHNLAEKQAATIRAITGLSLFLICFWWFFYL